MGTRERRTRSNEGDLLLSTLFNDSSANPDEVAIAAVGGFGRGELSPGSDLDIVIIHTGSIAEKELSDLVNMILYPLWDKNVKIDHSVRTRSEMRDAAGSDLKVALGLLDIRLVCGNPDLVAAVQVDALESWRKKSKSRLPELEQSLLERHQRVGELAYLLEPDLKEARGGLRDITALRAIHRSSVIAVPIERISVAESILANVREALHVVSGRDKDRLLFQEQDKVAEHLGYTDADALMSDVAQAARSVDYLLDSTWYRIKHKGRDGAGRFLKRVRSTPLSRDITISNKEVVISVDADFALDPVIGLRAAASAAQLGLPISMDSLERLSESLSGGIGLLTNPWPRDARENLITIIGAGSSMVQIFEALDQEEIIFHWIPEWRAVRSLPQRNVLHRHTVDRHMVETAVQAAALTREVHRPDILLFSALFHDIGKGTEEDHSDRGERLIEPLAKRIGFSGEDVETIKLLVKHHLLLSATATRRDLDDPATIASVVEVIPNLQVLELLHALSIADGEATGRAAWTDWKASLVAELVKRVALAITDNTVALQPELTEEQRAKADSGVLAVSIEDRDSVYAIEIVVPDKTGLLSIVAGVLNLLRLDVRSARTKSHGNSAVMEWIVIPDPHAPTLTVKNLHHELEEALRNRSSLAARIEERIQAYAQLPTIPVPDPVVETFLDAATDATIIEVRSHDRPALLFGIGDTITRSNIDIRSAIVTTLGAEAIDTLYVTEIGGGPLSPERAEEVATRLRAALK
ncbi:[protein-PII] uridylyltransferase [Candidatus Planktophila dulcis]|uniref:Bifunctional uridylyltransferase/uridylyl-removing enzyme n=1 Tax=Candidatus Planktophila dulcis TaxID=1884914 RepID=A0AAC9YTW5_9ACTN|nr:[protein-PII] uridylyltransferase [Candidatus Planktophila dulcis]ASY12174.1 [protein-PII] uridylyltransferase [Candidatus Planktophila dulcis]